MERYLIIDYKEKTVLSTTDLNDINSGYSVKCENNQQLAENANELLENDLKMLMTGKYF